MTPEEAYEFLLEQAMKGIGEQTTDVLYKLLEADQVVRRELNERGKNNN